MEKELLPIPGGSKVDYPVNHWSVEYSCGCKAWSHSIDAPPNYCPDHGEYTEK